MSRGKSTKRRATQPAANERPSTRNRTRSEKGRQLEEKREVTSSGDKTKTKQRQDRESMESGGARVSSSPSTISEERNNNCEVLDRRDNGPENPPMIEQSEHSTASIRVDENDRNKERLKSDQSRTRNERANVLGANTVFETKRASVEDDQEDSIKPSSDLSAAQLPPPRLTFPAGTPSYPDASSSEKVNEEGDTDQFKEENVIQKEEKKSIPINVDNDDLKEVKVMTRNLIKLTKKVQSTVESVVDIGFWVDQCEDLRNIIHSLSTHLEDGKMVQSVIDNKLAPLRRVLGEGMHKKCTGKFVIDMLVKVCNVDTLNIDVLNKFSAILRTVLYSTNSGGRKEFHGDNDEMQKENLDMKKRLTYICVNYIQRSEDIGRMTVEHEGRNIIVDKPQWMREGFTKGRHVSEFYKSKSNGKRSKLNADDDDSYLQHHIVKKINDFHNNAFNKLRDRVRGDGMKEFWFLLEDHQYIYSDVPPFQQPMADLSNIPLVNVSHLDEKERREVMKKVWNGMRETVGKSLSFKVEFDVTIRETKEIRRMRRSFSLTSVSAAILLRLLCAYNIFDLLALHKNIIRVIVCFAEVIRHIITVHRDGLLLKKLEDMTPDEPDYHVIKLVQDIRPSKLATRKELMKNHVIEVDESDFERFNDNSEDEDDEDGEHSEDIERLVDSDEEDGMDEELGDVIDSLLS